MSEIMTIKPRLHFIFPNESKFGVRNLFAGIVHMYIIFYGRQCEVTSRKYALKQGNRIGVHFIKYDI
jgi:hypothetical protein